MAKKEQKPQSALVVAYLLCYDFFCIIAWSLTLFRAVSHLISTKGDIAGFEAAVDMPLKAAQTVAILEIFHCMMGIVASPLSSTFLQVFSRIALLWIITAQSIESRTQYSYVTMVISWSCVELIRYPYYTLKQVGLPYPYFLHWLRYSAFLLLYPVGISSEIVCIYYGLAEWARTDYLNFPMPNYANCPFNFWWFVFIMSGLYLPGAPFLFGHMVKQRKKVLFAKPKVD